MAKTIDMMGFKTGLLTVIDSAPANNGAQWVCKCQCGNTIIVKGSKLRGASAPQSCGCLRTKKLIDYNHNHNIKDISQQRFGNLIAIKPTEKRTSSKAIIWECICDCGQTVEVSGPDLRSGNTKSCGCQRYKSFGEKQIETILQLHNISYLKEKSFSDLIFNDSGYQARFDFYVNNEYLIEFDGKQHYIQGNGHLDNKEKFEKTQLHDKIKNDYCKTNNIPLIRIPYTEVNNITLEMLQPQTSKYLLIYDN